MFSVQVIQKLYCHAINWFVVNVLAVAWWVSLLNHVAEMEVMIPFFIVY